MDAMKTGQLIAMLRKEKGLTQQQLADQLNLSNKTISKWESGAGSPDIGNLPVLADALGITVDELLRGEVMLQAEKEKTGSPAPVEAKRTLTPEQKKERAIVLFAACMGAILGILAYNFGWLG